MRHSSRCIQLYVFCVMVGIERLSALHRNFFRISSIRSSTALLFHPNTAATETWQSTRSFFTMKFEESRPFKKVDGATGKPRSASAKPGPTRSSTSGSKGPPKQKKDEQKLDSDGVRLNKCLHGLSRRGADDAIADGRVTINNNIATNGMKVKNRDIVRLVSIICKGKIVAGSYIPLKNGHHSVNTHLRP